MRTLKLSLIIPLFIAALALPLFVSNIAGAIDEDTKNAACEGLGLVGEDCEEAEAGEEVDNLVATAVNILSWIVGVAAVIMIIIGGFKYVTANGDSNAISSAKTTIIYAMVGLALAAVAQGIVQFVLKETTTNPPPAPSGGSATVES